MSIRDNLNGNIEALKHNLSSPYNFKGSTTFAALPASGNNVNDTYYCTDKKCNYTWNGSAWKQSSIGEAEYQAQLTQLEENFNGEISNLSSEIVDLYNHSSGVQKTLETLPRDANCYQYVSGSWVIAPLEGYAYGLTDYIEVIPYSTVIISAFFRANSEFASYALYDKNKNAIHYGNTTNDNVEVDAVNNKFALDYEITIPSNAKYIRVVAWENDYLIDNPFYVKYDVFVDAVVNELQSNVIQLYEHSRLPKTLKSLPTDTNCYKYVSGAWTIFELQDENVEKGKKIKEFVKYLNKSKTPLYEDILYFEGKKDDVYVEVSIQHNDGFNESTYGFVNNINTPEGGTHIEGFKRAMTKTFNDYARANKILKDSEPNLSGDDIREGLTAIVSIKIGDPQFEGQTKQKLGNSEARGAVDSIVNEQLTYYLEQNPTVAKVICEKSILAQRAREAQEKQEI